MNFLENLPSTANVKAKVLKQDQVYCAISIVNEVVNGEREGEERGRQQAFAGHGEESRF